jgi:phosphopantothenoylcysteine decarboxylase / phosphopantothenate---cysteine ligase
MRIETPLRLTEVRLDCLRVVEMTNSAFEAKTIALGVSGGIAAYKSATIASLLVQAGATVDVIMTAAAQQFIQPLTFSAITQRPVLFDPFAPVPGTSAVHVEIGQRANLLIIAPATARIIAALACGLSDDLITLVALSTAAPVLIAPAMEDQMYNHPATRSNISTLEQRGAYFVGPERGRLASGRVGDGRLADPETIVAAAERLLSRSHRLTGKKVVITAGGTREAMDPVRYLGNRSSGRMGFALAEVAAAMGARVTLISGPSELRPPAQVDFIPVESAAEMQRAVESETRDANALIMAAAVADFRPAAVSEQKIKKELGDEGYLLELIRNPDILASLDRPSLLKVGFAAETENLIENASNKLHRKGLAMIVANDARTTIGAVDSEATIVTQDGLMTQLPRLPKEQLATKIIQTMAELLERQETER